MKAARIIEVLRRRHPEPQWVVFEELRLGSGYGFHERRIDFWALDCAPSRGNEAVAYEVKISRGDFSRDVAKPAKQRGALLYSNRFYYAVPAGLITPNEVPHYAGLIEIESDGRDWCEGKVTLAAPHREKFRPSWPFIVSLVRRERLKSRPLEVA